MALGATRHQVLTLVLRQSLSVAGIGITVGVVMSLGLARYVVSNVGELPAFDSVAYTLAALAVIAITFLASTVPARRAASVEPMTVLRNE